LFEIIKNIIIIYKKFNSKKIIIVLAIIIIIILITNSTVSKKEPYEELLHNNTIYIEPAYIEMELSGKKGDTNITLTFRSINNIIPRDLVWNVNIKYDIAPNSYIYIYIGGDKFPSILLPFKLNKFISISKIRYEIRDANKQVIPSTHDAYNWVKIFVKDGQYVIQPTISGDELLYKTRKIGLQSYKIIAIPGFPILTQQELASMITN
jgi:hypothetical protein